jgi:hypothetical protein
VSCPINDSGYVYSSSGVDVDDESSGGLDYPITRLEPGDYTFLITNDIRYLETTYSISINVAVLDWRFVAEDIEESLDFGSVLTGLRGLLILAPWQRDKNLLTYLKFQRPHESRYPSTVGSRF